MSSISSRRRRSSATPAQAGGSAHRLAAPCDRSLTPLSCGRRGGFQSTATPRPISHNARSVGRSPAEPHGAPLSTRIRSGRPQRVNAHRNRSWTSRGATSFQEPWGENVGPEYPATTLVSDPQPRYLLAGLQRHLLRRGGGQTGPKEPALEGAHGGQRVAGMPTSEHHADQTRPPTRVVAAQAQGRLHAGFRRFRCRGPTTSIGGHHRGLPLQTEASHQPADCAWGEAKCRGEGGAILTVAEAPPD